ncbi:MAG: cytochrome c nitrite reductase small subunit [Armatimonadetes bacterium]|nr:cytochrome c nitrite reductase small subunit [Armatimonadota bacterium]
MNWTTTAYLSLGAMIGVASGIGGFTFVYAKGYSYLTNDPAACANCHIMSDQYEGWTRSSHHAVAVCNDCHTPHNFVGKWSTKALNGFWHSYYFTTGTFPEPIRIGERSRKITEEACRSCHQGITQAIEGPHRGGEKESCIRCHDDVGHQ